MKKMTKAEKKRIEARVSRAYGLACHGVQVDIFDLGKVQQAGVMAVLAGATDDELGCVLAAFVQTIRKN